ncbi:MAG: HipA domain-containing protein [Nocardioidaceae bacterium]|nr:HipA domain-containing protein [Nocardioidaceae bacterium]
MTNTLAVVMEGVVAGTLTMASRGGALSFRYEPSYAADPNATPLSVGLPVDTVEYRGSAVTNWLRNLLPDSSDVLDRWGRLFGVSSNSPFRLLEHVGRDVAGAAQFVPVPDGTAAETIDLAELADGGVQWLDDDELAARLAEVRTDPAAWTPEMQAGLFSLAGAQAKLALRYDEKTDRWGLPTGAEPTTRILKPYNDSLPNHALNEHLTLRLASQVGLNVATSTVADIGGYAVLVVERYDRFLVEGSMRRVHQEDLCQALRLPPGAKYETDGGPGIVAIVKRLEALQGVAARADVDRFLAAQAFAWATAGTDAHAKNYSLLLAGSQVRLAPLYDLQSAAPYFTYDRRSVPKGAISSYTAGLAMAVGGTRRFHDVTIKSWRKLAEDIGRTDDDVLAIAHSVVDALPAAVASVVGSAEALAGHRGQARFLKTYEATVVKHASAMRHLLDGKKPYGVR